MERIREPSTVIPIEIGHTHEKGWDLYATEHAADLQEWQEIIAKSFVPMVAGPIRTSDPQVKFKAHITRVQAGQVGVSLIKASPHIVNRSKELVRLYPAGYFKASLQLEGTTILHQFGREARILPGNISLYDASHPYSLRFPEDNTSMVIQLPSQLLPFSSDQIRSVLAVPSMPIPGMQEFLTHLVSQEMHRHREATFVGQAIGSMLSASLVGQFASSTITSAPDLFERIKTYSSTHLSNPYLDQQAAADANFISVRNLQRIFSQHGMSFAKWLREQRLERSKVYLMSAEPSISQIASDCGFSSPQVFSKLFKLHFGCTATTWRSQHLHPSE